MTAKYTNVSDVPLALAVFLATDYYDYSSEPNTISATSLIKPIRQLVLAPRVPPGEALPRLGDMVRSRMGTAIHNGIEQAWKSNYRQAFQDIGIPNHVTDRIKINPLTTELTEDTIPVYMEERLERVMGKWKVTGKPDFIGDGRVQDYKSTSVFTYMNQTNAEKFTLQGSIYRWLKPEVITDDQMDIHYLFTDHKSNMVRSDPRYPRNAFLTQTYDLLSLRDTEQFVKDKLAATEKYMDADEADIPLCDDKDLWRSAPVFKYYKNGDTSASRSTKNFETYPEAVIFMSKAGGTGVIKEVPGQVVACKYCPAFAACSQKDQLITSGDLIMS